MPRFHFIVHDGEGVAPDEEGAELADLESARSHAIDGARSMMSHSVRVGELDLAAFIEIADAARTVVARITFRDALSIRE